MLREEADGTLLKSFDRLGMGLSTACAVHCVLVPLLVTALPLLGLGFLMDHRFEALILVLTLTLAATTYCWGSRVHRRRSHFVALFLALLLFSSAHFTSLDHGLLMAFGGICLASGHFLNRYFCRSCTECRDHH